ncbi:MAG TPA: carboxypeptidase-like regulatory domain-containing protein [Polyangiaceae bacterium]|nr:carboxypeptidase-like regulatory domain-containing protein [Polyangiaceae bacterium]
MNPRFALPLAAPPVLALLIAAACSGTHVYLGGGQSAGASNAGGSSSLALGGMAADVGGSGAGAGAPNGLLVDPDPNTICAAGQKTTVTGTVYDPAGNSPLYNAVVYVPSAAGALPALASGVACEKCTDPLPARAVALSGPDGKFRLEDVPAGRVDLVVQLGKWRRKQTISVVPCQDNPLSNRDLTRLPRTRLEGDIPKIALSTGHSDALECLLRKIGIADSEFTTDAGGGRVSMFVGCEGDQADKHTGANVFADRLGGALFPSTSELFDSGTLNQYDVVIFSCEGHKCDALQTPGNVAQLLNFADRGGRVFLDHNHYNWLSHASAPIEKAAEFSSSPNDIQSPLATKINTVQFPKGEAFAQWLLNVQASTSLGALDIYAAKTSVQSLSPNRSQSWIYRDDEPQGHFYFTINTPVAVEDDDPAPEACGRVVFTDLHVSKSGGGDAVDFSDQDTPFPDGCTSSVLTPQEKALEFMLFDLSSCVQQETSMPKTPPIR